MKLFSIPPSWKLRKCIQVCKDSSSMVKTRGCDGDSPCINNKICKDIKCCEDVKLCVFPGDKLEVDYVIFASKTSQGAIVYTANVILCNDHTKKLKINIIKVIVEEKKGGKWTEISDSTIKRELDVKIRKHECVNATLAGSFPDSVGNNIRLKIRVIGPRCDQTIYERIDKYALINIKNSNTVDKWEILDDGLDGFPQEITDSSTICAIPKLYDAQDCEDPTTIFNRALLREIDHNTDDCITTSNKTTIKRKCAELKIWGKAKLECRPKEQWCLCKESKRVECISNNLNEQFIEYTVTATRIKQSEECKLFWEFKVEIDCLSYEKEFKYKVKAGGAISTDTFTLGPGKHISAEFSGEVIDANPDAPDPVVKICWNTDIYKLDSCKVVKDQKGKCVRKPMRFATHVCDTKVELTDTLQPEPSHSARFADPRHPVPPSCKQFICDHTFIEPDQNLTCNIAAARISKLLGDGIDPTLDLKDNIKYVRYNFLVHVNEKNKRIYNKGHIVVKDCDDNILNESSAMVCDRNTREKDD